MNRPLVRQDLPDEPALEAFAARMAGNLRAPLVIYLQGPLGAGKTTFVRALLAALGYRGRVKSPTYGLLEHYDFEEFTVYHLDLYRVENEAELEYLGLRDLFGEDTVLLIEWPARGGEAIPAPDLFIRFSDSVTERSLTASALSAAGSGLLPGLADA